MSSLCCIAAGRCPRLALHVSLSQQPSLLHNTVFYVVSFCFCGLVSVIFQFPVQSLAMYGTIIRACCWPSVTEGTSLSTRVKEILESHSQHCSHLWEGCVGSRGPHRSERNVFVWFVTTRCTSCTLLTFPNMCQVCPRWSGCCAAAVPSFTWGWRASWQTSHLPN